jgi:sporulation protein YlmC with PRC-barrel domain
MTKFKTMAAMSIVTIMLPLTSFAGETVPAKDTGMMSDIKSGLRSADESMRETAEDIKVYFMGKNPDDKIEPVYIRRNTTAHGLIGQTIVTKQGAKIATVKDIIVDKNGKASMLVVSDAGLLGIGNKVAAFDYNRVIAQKPDGKVVMTLSQDMIDRAADFSYDQEDWAKAKIIPTGSMSVIELLDGNVLDNNDKEVAEVENVYIRNADVSQIIVRFNESFGMGGDLAALNYDNLMIVKEGKKVDFKLTPNQSDQFKNFKKSVAN